MFANTPTPWGGVNSQKYCEGINEKYLCTNITVTSSPQTWGLDSGGKVNL